MITTVLLCAAALLGLLLIVYAARDRARPMRSVVEVFAAIRPVDVAAFRNLMDSGEEEYLRANLPKRDFRRIQRARARAAMDYVRRTGHNAALLIRVGDCAGRSANAEVARAGRQLSNDALQLRIRSLQALLWLGAVMVIPQARIRLSSLLGAYMTMRDRVVLLTRLETPTAVSRVEAVL